MPGNTGEAQTPHELEKRLKSADPSELFVTRRELDLSLNALKSHLTVLVLASVALNQFLGAVAIPSFVTGAAAIGLTLKVALAAFAR